MDFAINILDKINSNSGTVSVTGNSVGTGAAGTSGTYAVVRINC